MNAETIVSEDHIDLNEVFTPITLPCGRTLQNRLVKAATYEHLASYLGGPPKPDHLALYSVWASGGWGMITTGNVQISAQHLTLGADMVVPMRITQDTRGRFRKLAMAIKGGGVSEGEKAGRPLAIMQLSHAGRQSPNIIGGRWPFVQRPMSASATRVGVSSARKEGVISCAAHALLFQTAREMSEDDVAEVVDGFVRGAKLAVESGFDGVQLHAAHGYLLAQFISRKTNLRTDMYATPLVLLHTIVRAIRSVVPHAFVLGIKLNAADYVMGGLSEADGRTHLVEIAGWDWDGTGVDYIEISGGDYESPEFMQDASPRQAFFEAFSRVAVEAVQSTSSRSRSRPPPLIMLTGGLRSRTQFANVLRNEHANLLGLARLATLQPGLPNLLRAYHASQTDDFKITAEPESGSRWHWESCLTLEPQSPSWWPRIVGAGVGMAWYVVALRRLARGKRLPYGDGWVLTVVQMYLGELFDIGMLCAGIVATVVVAFLAFRY